MRMSVFSHFMFGGFCLVLLPVFICAAVIGLILDLKSSVLNISHPSVLVLSTCFLHFASCRYSLCSVSLQYWFVRSMFINSHHPASIFAVYFCSQDFL